MLLYYMPVAIRRLCKVSIFLVVVIKNTIGFNKNWLRNVSVDLSLQYTYVCTSGGSVVVVCYFFFFVIFTLLFSS